MCFPVHGRQTRRHVTKISSVGMEIVIWMSGNKIFDTRTDECPLPAISAWSYFLFLVWPDTAKEELYLCMDSIPLRIGRAITIYRFCSTSNYETVRHGSHLIFNQCKATHECELVLRKCLLDALRLNVSSKRSTTRSETKGYFLKRKKLGRCMHSTGKDRRVGSLEVTHRRYKMGEQLI